MPVTTGDMLLHLSSDAGSGGGALSGSTVTSGVTNNVFPDITDEERLAGGEVYRKVFWKNHSASSPLIDPVLFLTALPLASTLSIGLGFDSADDASPSQGNMAPLTANTNLELVSDGDDLRVATVWGVDSGGVPVAEPVELAGAVPVLTTTTWQKVWAVELEAIDASRSVEVRQGAAGPVRGSIPIDEMACWLWLGSANEKALGLALPDLGAGQSYGVWMRLAWLPGADPARPNSATLRMEEA
jgi:hypothetical protein